MIEELDIHNQFKESLSRFKNFDPHLKRISNVPYVYRSPLLGEENFHSSGIYLITGGRQVGKTTFLKQFIVKLVEERDIRPENILFITGEIIDDHHILRRIISQFYENITSHGYLFVDEINYIRDWDKSIKYLSDAGFFEDISVILTGSDSQVIRTSMKRFAGRRGASDRVDFDFHPLSFKDFVCLIRKDLKPLCDSIVAHPLNSALTGYENEHNKLTGLLYKYLIHGGYLPAINEYHLNKTISKSVMNIYIHWIIGDILKYNKSENYLFEILKGIKSTYNSQISWNSLSKYLSIQHHKTVSDYCSILESMHVLHIQEAILEHKLTGAPKKNRKIYFRDPFIDHAITNYLNPDMTIKALEEKIQNNVEASTYVEAICVDHCKRWLPTYYIKGSKGEVDLALVKNGKLYPIEVKWTSQVRNTDLKQIRTYENGIVLTPGSTVEKRLNIFLPLVRFLIHVSGNQLNI